MRQLQQMQRVQRNQAGFTLIELVVVIVILGILAATAIPRFADMSTQAKQASRSGVEGAVRSANAIVHAQALVDDTVDESAASGETVTLEGQTIDLVFGYPAASSAGIVLAVDTDVPDDGCGGDGDCAFQIEGQTDCTVTFTEAVDASTPPVIGGDETCS